MPKRYHQNRDQLHDPARKEAFGLSRKAKWPDAGLPPRLINGVWHVVLSKDDVKNAYLKRRCVATCPDCGYTVCAGHLGQHREMHRHG